jgi:hypothetical protein
MSLSGSGGPAPATALQPASGAAFVDAAKRNPVVANNPIAGTGTPPSAPVAPIGPISTDPVFTITPPPKLTTTTGVVDPSSLSRQTPSDTLDAPPQTTRRPNGSAMQQAGQNAQDMLEAVQRGGFAAPRPPMATGYAGPLSARDLRARTAQLLSANPQLRSILNPIIGGL